MPRHIRRDPDEDNDVRPSPTMPPEREQPLIALLAEAIVAVWQREQEADHEAR